MTRNRFGAGTMGGSSSHAVGVDLAVVDSGFGISTSGGPSFSLRAFKHSITHCGLALTFLAQVVKAYAQFI